MQGKPRRQGYLLVYTAGLRGPEVSLWPPGDMWWRRNHRPIETLAQIPISPEEGRACIKGELRLRELERRYPYAPPPEPEEPKIVLPARDDEIDTSEIPEVGEEFFSKARLILPDGTKINLGET